MSPRAVVLAILASTLTSCASGAGGQPDHVLSDRDLADYASRPFDKRAMMFQHVILGVHRGARVVADFPCGDLCPAYTARIIHYDAKPGPDCAAIGGVDQPETVPRGIGVATETFCEPTVLVKRPT